MARLQEALFACFEADDWAAAGSSEDAANRVDRSSFRIALPPGVQASRSAARGALSCWAVHGLLCGMGRKLCCSILTGIGLLWLQCALSNAPDQEHFTSSRSSLKIASSGMSPVAKGAIANANDASVVAGA